MKGSDWIQSCWNRKLSFSFCLLIKKPDFLLKYLKSQFWFELTWVRAGPGLGSERKDEPSTVLIAPKILWKRQLQRERERDMGKVAVAVIVSLWVISLSILVNHIVPEPYMVSPKPQTQKNMNVFENFADFYLVDCIGWNIPHTSGTTVLHWQFQKLGSHDYHPSWPVHPLNLLHFFFKFFFLTNFNNFVEEFELPLVDI